MSAPFEVADESFFSLVCNLGFLYCFLALKLHANVVCFHLQNDWYSASSLCKQETNRKLKKMTAEFGIRRMRS